MSAPRVLIVGVVVTLVSTLATVAPAETRGTGEEPSVPFAAGADLPRGRLVGQVAPGSVLITCDRSDERIEIDVDSHLESGCTWTNGFDVTGSDLTFDCRGARIARPSPGGRGISIQSPTTVPLRDVTVRNCVLSNFLNNIKVTRLGFLALTPDTGYLPHEVFDDVLVENTVSEDSWGVGIFVDGFVTGVTLRDLEVTRAGSSGIYLETDSRGTEVTRVHVHHNGHRENGPAGTLRIVSGQPVWFWGTGREGISVDGSSFNHLHDNLIEENVAGAIFLYKNCGEFPESAPERWWPRFQGSHENLIEHNTVRGELQGVWIGSRMAENQYFMECTDDAYGEGPGVRYHEDHADRNIVRDNGFVDVRYGVRVEDDGATVAGNTFAGSDPSSLAVVVGTRARAELLDRPVIGASITGNHTDLVGIDHPYRWIPSESGTVFTDNWSRDRLVGWCEGVQPRINVALFVVALAIPPPADTTPPPLQAPVDQPPCPDGVDPPQPSTTTSTTVPSVSDVESAVPVSGAATPGAALPATAPPAVAHAATPRDASPAYTG